MPEMDDKSIEVLESAVDCFGVKEVLSKLGYICGEKADHVATNWQDMKLAKQWNTACIEIDAALAKLEDADANSI